MLNGGRVNADSKVFHVLVLLQHFLEFGVVYSFQSMGRHPQGASQDRRTTNGRTMCCCAQSVISDLAAEWAQLKPRLAHHWPFELDVFQKQAIWHLERVCPETLFLLPSPNGTMTCAAAVSNRPARSAMYRRVSLHSLCGRH